MPTITPFIWFNADLQDVVAFYRSVFPDARMDVNPLPEDNATAEIEIEGQRFIAFQGGPEFELNESFSFFVVCEDQAEVDHYWKLLTADGGEESQCGWLKDRFGLSWQVLPKGFWELMQHGDSERKERMFAEMLTMQKLDMARLQRAFDGDQ
ncbi:VOC family protein [bacterium]|jgi:predicted 3-demethylubiquinone-9 3-methyltransferase (glyoxalase superfamily)|nr:VOC family protein [bacterium]